MANTIKLRTLLRIIDKYATVYFVIKQNGNSYWSSDGYICSIAKQKYKELLYYNVINLSTDCDGSICIVIENTK